MIYKNFRDHFMDSYGEGIEDPVIKSILDALEVYAKELQEEKLLSNYYQRTDQLSDGFYEVLCRHLFGRLYPNLIYVVLDSTLKEIKTAQPVLLGPTSIFKIQIKGKNRSDLLFAPVEDGSCIVPVETNTVSVDSYGDDLLLRFSIITDNLRKIKDGFISVYFSEVEPILLEKIKCQILFNKNFSDLNRPRKLGVHLTNDIQRIPEGNYCTPFQNNFLYLPFDLLLAIKKNATGHIEIPVPGLGIFAQQLSGKVTLNSYIAWNLIYKEVHPQSSGKENLSFKIRIEDMKHKEIKIISIYDLGSVASEGSIPWAEYISSSTVIDPTYPRQFTAIASANSDEIEFKLTYPAVGPLKVKYYEFSLEGLADDISKGSSFQFYQGILPEGLKSTQSTIRSQRIDEYFAKDKNKVWDDFRSLLASRNRWITKDDLKMAIALYPGFGGKNKIVDINNIIFTEKIGRSLHGFLTPFTEIRIPVLDVTLLHNPYKNYFEERLREYIMSRSVNGNFVKVLLVEPDQ